MIVVFVMGGMVCGMCAGVASLIIGHSWWMALASYSLTGIVAVPLLALLAWGLKTLRNEAAETTAPLHVHVLASKN